jgi:transposase-like protein
MSQSTVTDTRAIHCPFCDSAATELISLFGSQLLLSQYRCKRCGSYFETVRGDDADGG